MDAIRAATPPNQSTKDPVTSHTSQPINGCAVPLGRFRAGSPEWHTARTTGLGGSEIAAVLGLSPWESYWSLWHRKQNLLPPVRENLYMRMGSLFEPVIYDHYERELLPPDHTMTTGWTYRHIDRPWMIANPDGLIWNPDGDLVDGIEIKCAARDHQWGPEGTDAIPIYYKTQICWYCIVLGLDGMNLRVVFGVGDWRTYRYEPTAEDIDTLITAGADFMAALAARQPPNLDSHLMTYEAVRTLHPEIDGSTIQISADLADRWWTAQAEFATAERQLQHVRNELADTMGDAWRAQCGDQTLAWRQRPRGNGVPFLKSAPNPHHGSITEALPKG